MLVQKSLLFLPYDISQILLLAVYRERYQIVYLEFGLDSTKIIIFKEPKTSPTLVKEKK